MSVQNNLIRPSFSKSVMGYTQAEVDKYVEHVSERYNSVCRENAELKRRLLAMNARLDDAESKIAELEKFSFTKKVLDKSELNRVFDALNAEKARYECFINDVMERLNSICVDDDDFYSADDGWQSTLEDFIEEVDADDESEAKAETAPKLDEPVKEEAVNIEPVTPPTVSNEEADDVEEYDELVPLEDILPLSEAEKFVCSPVTYEDDEISCDECVCAEESKACEKKETRSPAEIAAELDFYTEGAPADGESFDPMTLAAEITSKNRRPTIADFMKPLPSDDN